LKLVNKQKLYRLQRKNRGNKKLIKAINKLIDDLESTDWDKPRDLLQKRPDADNVYKGKFYFFDIHIHRTLILIEFEEDGAMTVVWVGNHNEYKNTFKNNRRVIRKWLIDNEWI
jgi:mRNA interferase HigB